MRSCGVLAGEQGVAGALILAGKLVEAHRWLGPQFSLPKQISHKSVDILSEKTFLFGLSPKRMTMRVTTIRNKEYANIFLTTSPTVVGRQAFYLNKE